MLLPPIRVSIESDRAVVALGLVALLGRYPDRAGVVDDQPHVILYDVDVVHPGTEQELSALTNGSVAVVALLASDHPDLVAQLTGIGVAACVSVDLTGDELLAVLEAVARGDKPADRRPTPLPVPDLTPREREIIGLVAAGLSNSEIALDLQLSMNTVKTYIRTAYRKMDVRTRSQAVTWAAREGLVETRRTIGAGRPGVA